RHANIVELLIKKEVNVNYTLEIGFSVLNYAIEFCYTGIATLLLNHGADINYINMNGQTPLDHALQKGHMEIVELLQNAGALKSETSETCIVYLKSHLTINFFFIFIYNYFIYYICFIY